MVVGGGVQASGSSSGAGGSGDDNNGGEGGSNQKWNILDPETILDHCVSHDGKRLYLVKWKPKWVKKNELPEGVFEKWQARKKGIGLDEPEDGLRILEERRVTPEELTTGDSGQGRAAADGAGASQQGSSRQQSSNHRTTPQSSSATNVQNDEAPAAKKRREEEGPR